MAHNIHKGKFLTLRKPAWHGLGLVIQDEISGVEAGERIGIPMVFSDAIYTQKGVVIPGYKCIFGKEKNKDAVPFSVVTDDYHEVKHSDFLEAWDNATNKAPIETIGVLGKGEHLFVTTKLPMFDVKGDECESYLLATNMLNGKDANYGRVTPVRVVCQNTLNLSSSNYTDQIRVIHKSESIKQIQEWLRNVWESTKSKGEALKEAYTILANHTPKTKQVNGVLSGVYPTLEFPEHLDPTTKMGLDALALIEKKNKNNQEHREQVLHLFEGDGLGSDLKSAQGTSWGLWNAVVEYEDHMKSYRRASSSLFGPGAERKQVAFDSLYELARG